MKSRSRRVFTNQEKLEIVKKINANELTPETAKDKEGKAIHPHNVEQWLMLFELGKLPDTVNLRKRAKPSPQKAFIERSNDAVAILRDKLSEYIRKATELEIENVWLKNEINYYKNQPNGGPYVPFRERRHPN